MNTDDQTSIYGALAFRNAIESGALSVNRKDINYVMYYMYTHTVNGLDHFKNIKNKQIPDITSPSMIGKG